MTDSNRTPEKAIAFCAVLAETGNVSMAMRGAGLGRTALYEWRKEDPEFAKHWDEALMNGVEALEDEANRRAFHGTDEPVYYLGGQCGVVKRFSDTLAIFLLKAHKPLKYRERFEHTGKDGVPLLAPTIIIGGPPEPEDSSGTSGAPA